MDSASGHDNARWFDPSAVHRHFTGGQYSVIRVFLALFVMLHLLMWLPSATLLFSDQGLLADGKAGRIVGIIPNVLAFVDSSGFVIGLILFACGMSLLLAAGLFDRFAAVVIWYVVACLHGRNPVSADVGLPMMGWVLLIHAMMPAAPFGSFAARGRADPSGGWAMPRILHGAAWFMLALAYAAFGVTKLGNEIWMSGDQLMGTMRSVAMRHIWLRDMAIQAPDDWFKVLAWVVVAAELAFAPLALWSRARPVIWAWTLVIHQALLASMVFNSLECGLLMLHLMCFDPGWIKSRQSGGTEIIRYDGHCGLCHSLVRFIIAEDSSLPGAKAKFQFAPLAEGTDARSMIVETVDGRRLTRATAVLHVLRGLGGIWAVVADFLSVIPKFILNLGYSVVAGVRGVLFRTPKSVCPVVPPHLSSRFLDADDAV